MASANAKISLAHFRVLHIVPSNHWSSERHFSRHPDAGGDADHTIVDWYNCNYQRHLYAASAYSQAAVLKSLSANSFRIYSLNS